MPLVWNSSPEDKKDRAVRGWLAGRHCCRSGCPAGALCSSSDCAELDAKIKKRGKGAFVSGARGVRAGVAEEEQTQERQHSSVLVAITVH